MEPWASSPATTPQVERKFHVLVGVTGSVAALKLPLLVSRLLDIPGLEVIVVTTERAKHFYSPQDVPVSLYSDTDEWEMWKRRSDPVLHIELRRWADLMLVAPLDANTLGKVASGICDNLLRHTEDFGSTQSGQRGFDPHSGRRGLFHGEWCGLHWLLSVLGICWALDKWGLQAAGKNFYSHGSLRVLETCVIRAWDHNKPLLFCPAMNTAMWEHPVTAQQVGQLKAFGYTEVPCVAKKLVCGDQGLGAMAEVETIVEKVKEVFSQHHGIQQS
ncbi:phosphopantothenoylcysteine decarboxylase isoform X1 [Cavia porcellus]|nr:phosphopantothenoylcysteine decarboxylase isoform X1 [Cavia porcellus]XP_013001072.1 phosphopantothenoylcysteine decarboxylase isoform X1 [Cavia porcellus]XP_013001073.1 phosphopantothenoylcysteine decarboxylase isoform X1 [Cavia porcellus]XP_023418063.1 phosphopantothenoylcysteine decarboxylase isoform X1 [Cavia porcellus]